MPNEQELTANETVHPRVAGDVWLNPHLAALESCVRAGFRFAQPPDVENMLAVQGARVRGGAMDMFVAWSAFAPQPLWHQRGAVADVVMELLALPFHGSPGAPSLAESALSDLWLRREAR